MKETVGLGRSPCGGSPDGPGYKAYRVGTHRAVAPAETIARVTPFLEEMGITRVADVTGLDRIGIPVVMVVRPNSRSVAVSQGKGLDLEAAKASGLMESIESWHAERITLPVKHATCADLARDHEMIDLDRLPAIRDGRFHRQRRLLWIEGRNLVDDRPLWLPYEMVHTDYTHPLAPGSGCFHASTNGLASGNHILEAVCHAICEVIERDATGVWHHLPPSRRAPTRLALDSVEDPACREILAAIEAAGLELAVWDTTGDVAVAAFYAVITESGDATGHLGAGAGCHPSREVALLRTLTEAVQTRMTYVTGSRDDLSPEEFTPQGRREKREAVQALLRDQSPVRQLGDIPTNASETFEQDLSWLIERLGRVGIHQVAAVDLTRPEIGVPVVRVVIPGLEAPHDDDDYVAGPRAVAALERGS